MLLYPTMPLSDVIGENPSLIPVVARFGISLGLGESTIAEVAAAHGVDGGFFVAVLNTFLDDGYFPEKKLRAVEQVQITDYLRRTNRYYLESQLPNIERHLQAFIARSRVENNSLELLRDLFVTFRDSLTAQIQREQTEVFPALAEGRALPRSLAAREDAGEITELLSEMQGIMIRHLKGDYDMNLCHAVVLGLDSLRRDIAQHDRIRDRILYRAARGPRRQGVGTQGDKTLTPREIDVLKLVTQGKINRQIADELCISFQTVLSHRKNITAKLGIKSVSGLTMYALMHGYM
ncbi:MAG: LuxR C-terminal-related transcriptional regulator [Rikenellaceae bacterium]|jgi:regulator of cell morphogenesis and NO signaling|nr:LuxR C-terminal-related transcriptional regulator [Rikenellaceae bacterium]